MSRKQKRNTKLICLGDWDYESDYTTGRIEAIQVYKREEVVGDYHQRFQLNINEKGNLYEEGRIKGYEYTYKELKLCGGRTWEEEYTEEYSQTNMSDEC